MRRLLVACVLIFLGIAQLVHADFNTISELVEYAKKLPEFPDDEYVDPYKPRYQKLHASLEPSAFDTLLSSVGLKVHTLYDDIKKRMRRLIDKRELHGFYGDFVQKFYIDVETKWYIWGPLHGAFHSLVRSLNELKEQGVLSNDLKLLKKRFYFVFNGNLLNYAPYQLETLYVVLHLMEKNPGQIFITRGSFEDKGRWKKTNLVQELKERIPASVGIPLENEFDHFFNTLPLALYLVSTELDIVRISFYENHPLLQEKKWGSFLNKKMSETKKIENIVGSDENVQLQAKVTGHDVKPFPYRIDSISYKRFGDSHVWSLFSSPILLFQQMFGFANDTAIVLTTGKFFSNWYIELYQQKSREKKGFIRARKFNIASGKEVFTANQEEHIEDLKQKIELAQLEQDRLKEKCGRSEQGIPQVQEIPQIIEKKEEVDIERAQSSDMALHDDLLVVGNMTDFSKGSKDWSVLLKKGLSLPIELINRKGGVNDTAIQLVFLDDQYNPELARKNIFKFLNDFKTDVLLGAKGTAPLAAYIDLIKAKKILSVFPNTGGFRDPDIPYLLHLRASYDDEGQAVAQYVLNIARKKVRDVRIAFLYQKDHYGMDLLNGAKKVLKKAGHQTFLEVPYETYMTDFSEQAELIRDFKPDIIGFFSLPDQTQKFIRQLGARYLLDKILFGNDRLGQQTFREFLEDRGLKMIIPQIVPNPHTSKLPIAQEFRNHARRFKVPIDTVSFEAYIQASLFIDLLKQLDEPFSKEEFVKLFESLKDYDYKGLKLTFDPQTRQLFHTLWIDFGTGDWVKEEPEVLEVEVKKPDRPQVGQEVAIKDGMLVVGSLQDLSKTVKRTSVPFMRGLQMSIQHANEQSQNEKKVRIVVLDDEYDPEKTREQLKRFDNEFKTDIILSAMGTPTLASYLGLIKDKKILSIFPYSGSYGSADIPYLIHLRVSNFDMGYTLTRYILSQHHDINKIAFLYQNDKWGKDTLAGAKEALNEKDIKDVLAVSYEPHQSSFEGQLQQITDFDPQAIGFLGISFASRKVISGLGGAFLLDKVLFGTDAHGKKEFKDFLKERGLNFTVAQVVPNPETSELPIVQEFRALARHNDIKTETISLEGYINGAVFVDILRKLEGPFSKSALVKQFEEIKNYDYKGLHLNFDSEKRQLLHTIWIDTGQGAWIAQDTNKDVEESTQVSTDTALKKEEPEAPIISSPDMAQQGNVLVLGTMQDLSKSVKDIGQPFKRGLLLPIDYANREGGINGLKIRLVALYDQYNPEITRRLVEKFINDYKTDVLLGAQGTPTLASYLDLIRQKKILSVFPYAGSYGELALPYLLKLRASYIDIGYALTKFLIEKKGKRKFAFFYQNDHFGGSNLIGAKRALKEAGIDDFLEVPYQAHEPEYSEQAAKIQSYKPEAIGLFSVPFASEKLLNEIRVESLLDKIIFANEFHGSKQLRTFIEQKGVTFVVAHVMPNTHESMLPIVREYRDRAKRANAAISEGGLEGYVTAALFVDILKQLELPFTKDKLVHFVEQIKDYNFKGLKLNFDQKTRQLFKTIWIDTGSGNWIEEHLQSQESTMNNNAEKNEYRIVQ